jgi:protein tyrosine/serine phosphatase
MKVSRRSIVLVIAALVIVGAAAGAGAYWYVLAHPIHHFAEVDPGVLYRSGQPNEAQLVLLTERYHLHTIVNLRGTTEGNADWYVVEQGFCAAHHLNFVSIDLTDPKHLRSVLRPFLEVVADATNRPVLVHCEFGSARTGFAVAAYRIVFQKWTLDQALAEAAKYRFDPAKNLNPEYVKILRELAAGADWHKLSD